MTSRFYFFPKKWIVTYCSLCGKQTKKKLLVYLKSDEDCLLQDLLLWTWLIFKGNSPFCMFTLGLKRLYIIRKLNSTDILVYSLHFVLIRPLRERNLSVTWKETAAIQELANFQKHPKNKTSQLSLLVSNSGTFCEKMAANVHRVSKYPQDLYTRLHARFTDATWTWQTMHKNRLRKRAVTVANWIYRPCIVDMKFKCSCGKLCHVGFSSYDQPLGKLYFMMNSSIKTGRKVSLPKLTRVNGKVRLGPRIQMEKNLRQVGWLNLERHQLRSALSVLEKDERKICTAPKVQMGRKINFPLTDPLCRDISCNCVYKRGILGLWR